MRGEERRKGEDTTREDRRGGATRGGETRGDETRREETRGEETLVTRLGCRRRRPLLGLSGLVSANSAPHPNSPPPPKKTKKTGSQKRSLSAGPRDGSRQTSCWRTS